APIRAATPPPQAVPIINPRKSVSPEAIICLECGKKCQVLKNHLHSTHGLTPDRYRDKYDLPETYPMVAEMTRQGYRERALKMNLGQRGREAEDARALAAEPPVEEAPIRKTRAALAVAR